MCHLLDGWYPKLMGFIKLEPSKLQAFVYAPFVD